MFPHSAPPTLPRINPAYLQFGRPKCVTVAEETPLAFVYHFEQLQLDPQWKYLRILPDRRSQQGWSFQSMQS